VASIRLQHAIAKELVFRFYKARVLWYREAYHEQ
jgi:hypothetical protein